MHLLDRTRDKLPPAMPGELLRDSLTRRILNAHGSSGVPGPVRLLIYTLSGDMQHPGFRPARWLSWPSLSLSLYRLVTQQHKCRTVKA